jgi:hypothetical protein
MMYPARFIFALRLLYAGAFGREDGILCFSTNSLNRTGKGHIVVSFDSSLVPFASSGAGPLGLAQMTGIEDLDGYC